MRQLLTLHQVAVLLGLPGARSLVARRRQLEEEHGFPPPVPGLGLRWDPVAIDAWLARHRPAEATPAATAEAILVQRARAMAGAAG